MKKIMILMMVVGSFWVGQVWADMERVSAPVPQTQSAKFSVSVKTCCSVRSK
jgi:hypothetical protein